MPTPPDKKTSEVDDAVSRGRLWRRIALATLSIVSLIVVTARVIHWIGPPEQQLTAVPLTSLPGNAGWPSFSPDGKQMVFGWDKNKGWPHFELFVQSVEGSAQPVQLTHNEAPIVTYTTPQWSPDGKWIAYTRYHPVLSQKPVEIVLVPAPMGGHELVLQRVYGSEISWSPDSEDIAFTDNDSPEQPAGIFLINKNTLERRSITPSVPKGDPASGDYEPVFSNDGKEIAFARSPNWGINELCVLTLSSGNIRVLFKEISTSIVGLAWAPSGKDLIYASDRMGIRRLWRLPATGGEPEALNIGEDAWSLGVSAVAHRLAYGRGIVNSNIWQIKLTEGGVETRTPMILSDRQNNQPAFSPDEKKIALVSDRSGFDEIWISNSDGSDPAQLSRFGLHKTGTPRWSPDGNWIAFDARATGHADLYLVNLSGANPSRLTSDGFDNSVPTWSPDGAWIYYESNRLGDTEIWKIPTEGGQPIRVTRHGGQWALVTPNGKTLYYFKGIELSELWQKDLPDGDEHRVPGIPDIPDLMSVQVTNDGIYFNVPDSTGSLQHMSLQYFTFRPGKTRRVTSLGNMMLTEGVSVSKDGRTIIYSQQDHITLNIMLVENFPLTQSLRSFPTPMSLRIIPPLSLIYIMYLPGGFAHRVLSCCSVP